MAGVLDGLRVLEAGELVAAGYCGRILADLGAEVTKLEPAPAGDRHRRLAATEDPLAHLFDLVNAGKRSLCIDPGHASAAEILPALAAAADVLLLGGADTWAPVLGAEPPLALAVTCVVTATGTAGDLERADPAVSDVLIQALAGTLAMNGDASGPPYPSGAGLVHAMTGIHACIAIIQGVLQQLRTGAAQRVEVPMLDTAISMAPEHHPPAAAARGQYRPGRVGRFSDLDTLGVYRARDGYIVIEAWGSGPESMWGRLATVIGRPDLIDDPRYSVDEARVTRWGALIPVVEGWLQSFADDDSAMRALASARVVAGRVRPPSQVLASEQLEARAAVATTAGVDGPVRLVKMPFRFSAAELSVGPVPRLGEHSAQVLIGGLGYSESQVDALVASGAVRRFETAP